MPLGDGAKIAQMLLSLDVTHVVWVPDSTLGTWDEELRQQPNLSVIRPCREGEAIGIAAGLWIGGARPLVVMQCTGLYEAGDALRNVVHDLQIPLLLLVGIRSHFAVQRGARDSAADFATPIVEAWRIEHTWIDPMDPVEQIRPILRRALETRSAHILLLGE